MADVGKPGDHHEALMALLKRRGFLAPAYEIYGGVAGFYDYGPLGSLLKNNLEAVWRQHFVIGEGFAEIQCPTVSPEEVWRASGHLAGFADVVIECRACGSAHRFDHFVRDEVARIKLALEKSKLPDAAKLAARTELDLLRKSSDAAGKPELARDALSRQITDQLGKVHARPRSLAEPLVAVGGFEETLKCQTCGKADLDEPRAFNLMFRTTIGPGKGRTGYLRPETAQGMFVTFPWTYRYFREKLPFGVVQLGRAYRNEIAPRQGLIRLREFNQAEAEIFFDPLAKSHPRFDEVKGERLRLVPNSDHQDREWALELAVSEKVIASPALAFYLWLTKEILVAGGVDPRRVRFRQHEKTEMAHYSTDTWDAEYLSARFDWVECVGIADRGAFDLSAHAGVSGQPLGALRKFDAPRQVRVRKVVANRAALGPVFRKKAAAVAEALERIEPGRVEAGRPVRVAVDGEDVEVAPQYFSGTDTVETQGGESFVPHVVEPSFGIDRILFAILEHSFDPSGEWPVLRLPAHMAPFKAGVFPLMARDGLDAEAAMLDRELRAASLLSLYDDSGSIGKRYARMDEIGTPFCVTVDYETLDGKGVTVRERDSARQARVPREGIAKTITALLSGDAELSEFPEVAPAKDDGG
ncbi:MAG: glycine--tRNA ligase [Methanobacteriota archaeon]